MQKTPIQTFIQKFRIQQVKSQLIRGLCQLAIGGILSLLILSLLESIYYFSIPVRSGMTEFFIFLFFIFLSYLFLRAYFHSKSLFNNSSNYYLANLFKDRDPDISDRLLNALQLEESLDKMEDGKDLAELRDEITELKEQGHRGFKAKVGGMELADDLRRLEVVRDVIGDSCNLMVDVNRAWDLDTATEAVQALVSFNPLWLEEPLRWADDRRELKLLSQRTQIPLSAGESELTSYGCRSLLEERAIQILQFDVTMFGGFTEGRKMAALCELNHVKVTPHHDCFIHAQLVASTPAGGFVEAFTNPERDPLQAELFENPPILKDGWLTLNDAPGLGLTLSDTAIAKYGERVI